MAPTSVTLNGLEGMSPVAGLLTSNSSNTYAAFFARFQMIWCDCWFSCSNSSEAFTSLSHDFADKDVLIMFNVLGRVLSEMTAGHILSRSVTPGS